MEADLKALISRLFERWQARDVEGVLDLCDPSICYRLHHQPHHSRFAGELRGKQDVRDYLTAVCANWHFVRIVPGPMQVDGDVVRETARFYARKGGPDGEVIVGCKRQEWLIINGLVARCDEFQDAEMIGAFIRYNR